eukprot:CAMPEP_0183293010 /NCGR_PEP_ID=MMETSP0160_2-20130417/1868_1 /TAXON_ID=2839 ORGANISM="Odontella Sinensis, Strain Grunow 1884" /NCGR_SAMPLE_ID=MMETSP0160_2 /ASSEMBLY_ACC=CAM_ASM_000250 /LENGTH=39 /DNA_ID= /DNA_START= /DNA_END= /DNA_ORIENTATION=
MAPLPSSPTEVVPTSVCGLRSSVRLCVLSLLIAGTIPVS